MKKEKEETKVNSFVSDHPWCTEKWSLTGGCRLWENVVKLNKLKLSWLSTWLDKDNTLYAKIRQMDNVFSGHLKPIRKYLREVLNECSIAFVFWGIPKHRVCVFEFELELELKVELMSHALFLN